MVLDEKVGRGIMKKIICLLLSMLVLTVGSPNVLAREHESMASDIGQSEFDALEAKTDDWVNNLFHSSDIYWDQAVKVYEYSTLFETVEQLDDAKLQQALQNTEYYWSVPTSHTQPKVDVRFDIVKDFDREEAKKAVADGLISAKSVAEREQQIGKWDITSVSEYDTGVDPFVETIATVLKGQSITPQAIYYIRPAKVMMDPIVLLKLADNEYRVLIHSLSVEESRMESQQGNLEFDTLYPYETAQKVLAAYLKEHQPKNTEGNTAPQPNGVRAVEPAAIILGCVVVVSIIGGIAYWKFYRKTK